MSNYIDRSIMAVISPAIKNDLGLTDTQLGFLKGFSFAFFFATFSIPIAWLADRWNRVSIISISMIMWSGFTAVTAVTTTYFQLLLTRVGIGVGGAGCFGPSHSIISDYYKKDERGRALAIYSLGVEFADALALVLGGVLLQQLGWRAVFLVIGLPGIVLAIILKLTVREPTRGATDIDHPEVSEIEDVPSTASTTKDNAPGLIESVKALLKIPSYRSLVAAALVTDFASSAFWFWMVDHLKRKFDLSYVEITLPLAATTLICASAGAYLGGYATDKLVARTDKAYGYVAAISTAGCAILLPFYLLAPTPFLTFTAGALFFVFPAMFTAPTYAAAQMIAPVRFRSIASSFLLACMIMFGVGLGPLWIGVVSDSFSVKFGEANGLMLALLTLPLIYVIALILYLQTGKRMDVESKASAMTPGT